MKSCIYAKIADSWYLTENTENSQDTKFELKT